MYGERKAVLYFLGIGDVNLNAKEQPTTQSK